MYNIITKRKRRGGFLCAFPFMDAAVLAPFSTKLMLRVSHYSFKHF